MDSEDEPHASALPLRIAFQHHPTPDEEGSSFVSLGERLGPCNPFNGDRRCADRVALTLEMIQQSHDAFDFVGFIEPFVVVTDRSVDGKDDREIRQPQLACK